MRRLQTKHNCNRSDLILADVCMLLLKRIFVQQQKTVFMIYIIKYTDRVANM